MKWCVVIPTYNNDKTLGQVIQDVLAVTADVIVVNDGSTDRTEAVLKNFDTTRILSYSHNRGKGYALKRGFELAASLGYSHAITVDSDGQHFACDIPAFIEAGESNPDALIIGSRKLPKEKLRQGSRFANRLSNFWFRFIAGTELPDTQCGFRLYPLHRLQHVHFFTRKYEFELEVLVRAAWRGLPVTSIPIGVFYPSKEERVSHYRPFRDFVRISLLYTILFFVVILYVKPFWFIRSLRKENIKTFINNNVLKSRDSTSKMTLSVMLGVFMGIVPIWGYQLITAIALAYLLRLNRFLVILAANISIVPMVPVILYLSYLTGNVVLGHGFHLNLHLPVTFEFVWNNLFQYIIGSMVLAILASVFFGLITYAYLKIIRRNQV